jgi:hypothetical protein
MIQSNEIAGTVYLDAECVACIVTGNGGTYPNPVIDNSTFPNTNYVTSPYLSYTPVWKADTADPVLNNGTMVSYYVRNGYMVSWVLHLEIANLTTLGTGQWYFEAPLAPFPNAGGVFAFTGAMRIIDTTTNEFRTGTCVINSGTPPKMYCFVDGGLTGLSATEPFAWQPGDTVDVSITYPTFYPEF